MATRVRGEIAKPGLAIAKFWQGLIEIVLRVSVTVRKLLNHLFHCYNNYCFAQVCCLLFLVISSLSLYFIRSKAPSSVSTSIDRQIRDALALLQNGYDELTYITAACASLGIGISIATLVLEFVAVLLRFLNISQINYKIKAFLSIVK